MAKIKPVPLISTAKISHDEWIEIRRGFIGGSDAATVVGLNPFSDLTTLYYDKLGTLPPKEDSESMRLGRDLEQYVADRFCEATGKKVRRDRMMYLHPRYDFIGADVDRRVVGEDAILECKTTTNRHGYDFAAGEIPLNWFAQCLHYLNVDGCELVYLAVLELGKGFYWFKIERDEAQQQALLDAEVNFWTEHIMRKIPPVPDGSDSAGNTISAVFSQGGGTDNVNLFHHDEELEEYAALSEEIKAKQKRLDEIKQNIQADMGTNEAGEATRFHFTWRQQTNRRVDYDTLRDHYPDAYAACVTQSFGRTFRVIKNKGE